MPADQQQHCQHGVGLAEPFPYSWHCLRHCLLGMLMQNVPMQIHKAEQP
jgi:hypothetical protein